MQMLFGERVQSQLRHEPCKEAGTVSRAKLGKETVAEVHRRPKWVPHDCAQANLGVTQGDQALLTLCSGMLTLGSGKSGSCLHLATKTEPAKEKMSSKTILAVEHNFFFSSSQGRLVSSPLLFRR
jgi:hypothetical protein